MPLASMMKVPRRAIPLSGSKTPYSEATPPCGQKSASRSKSVAFLFGVGAQRELAVHGNGEDGRVRILKHRKVVADFTELAGTDSGKGERVKNDDDVAPPQVRQPDGLAVLIDQFKVGSGAGRFPEER